MEFVGILDMGCGGKEGIDNDSKNFDLSNYKYIIALR